MNQLDELLKRAESGSMEENVVEFIRGMAECIAVLSKAVDDKPPLVDALSRNTPSEFDTILVYCLVQARRQFVDAAMNLPDECQFVIDTLAEVYRFDKEAKEQRMTPDQRLQYHQEKSAESMEELEAS